MRNGGGNRGPSKAQDPRVQRQVFALLPDLSIYEWRMLMYLLGPKEVVRRGPFEIFGTVLPGWTPEMVLTYQVMCAGCTEVSEKLIRAAGGDIQKYSSSLKAAKTQIAAVDRSEGGLSVLMRESKAMNLYREKGWRVTSGGSLRCKIWYIHLDGNVGENWFPLSGLVEGFT